MVAEKGVRTRTCGTDSGTSALLNCKRMNPDQWAKWIDVERRATKLLLMRRDEGPVLQIMEMPAEGDWVCWEFFSTPLGQQVYRSIWRRLEDLAKFESADFRAGHAPAPSVKTRSVNAPPEFGAETLEALRDMRISLLPEHDEADAPGPMVELSLSQPQVQALVRWHEPGPQAWREMTEWTTHWRAKAAQLF